MSGAAVFGAIPARASRDMRISAADFRVLISIASYDRMGKNGAGCFVDPRRLAEESAICYSHFARHTGRLAAFGYLEILRSLKDRRKRIYRLIYNESSEVVATTGDNRATHDEKGTPCVPDAEKVATTGDNPPEKVANPKSQSIDPPRNSDPLRDLAKQREEIPQSGGINADEMRGAKGNQKTRNAQQRETGAGGEPPGQRELRVSQDVNQKVWRGRFRTMSPSAEAERRLGNALVQSGYWEDLEAALKGAWDDCYQAAIKVECREAGKGLAYLIGCARKAEGGQGRERVA